MHTLDSQSGPRVVPRPGESLCPMRSRSVTAVRSGRHRLRPSLPADQCDLSMAAPPRSWLRGCTTGSRLRSERSRQAAGGYPGCVDGGQSVAVRTRFRSRPGRRALVVTDLADLRGPVSGTVRLPLWLYWSGPGPAFDLGEPFLRRWLYEIVPREAASPEDLTSYLGGTLIALWPDLYLPKGVRQAWEELHPVLRAAPAAPGDVPRPHDSAGHARSHPARPISVDPMPTPSWAGSPSTRG